MAGIVYIQELRMVVVLGSLSWFAQTFVMLNRLGIMFFGHVVRYMFACALRPGRDILNVYQFAFKQSALTSRSQLWDVLHKWMKMLPLRNTLVLAGDWNTSVGALPRLMGTAGYVLPSGLQGCGPQHRDGHLFESFLTSWDLVALNTWDNTVGPTFQSLAGGSPPS